MGAFIPNSVRSVKDLLGFITVTMVVAEPRPGVRDREYGSSTCLGSDEKDAEDLMLYMPPLLKVEAPVEEFFDKNGGEGFVGDSG